MTLVSKTWQLEQKSDNTLFKNKETIKMQLSVLIFRSIKDMIFLVKWGSFEVFTSEMILWYLKSIFSE